MTKRKECSCPLVWGGHGEPKPDHERHECRDPGGIPLREYCSVSVWEERDRLHIHVTTDEGQTTIAEWWDDDARSMIEDGFFLGGCRLKDSVLDYCAGVGWVA